MRTGCDTTMLKLPDLKCYRLTCTGDCACVSAEMWDREPIGIALRICCFWGSLHRANQCANALLFRHGNLAIQLIISCSIFDTATQCEPVVPEHITADMLAITHERFITVAPHRACDSAA
eukprot:scpid19632/ scgid17973/ 